MSRGPESSLFHKERLANIAAVALMTAAMRMADWIAVRLNSCCNNCLVWDSIHMPQPLMAEMASV